MAGYIRQDTTNNIADGNVINASDFDNEYNAIEAAFNASTGHTHDGTSAEGAPITKIGPTQDVVASASALTPKTDNAVDLGSATLEYKDLYIDGTANIDSLVADTADINAGTIDGVTIGGASAGAGTFTTVAATTGNITTVNATTVDATNVEVTNIKAKDGTASMTLADATGVATFSANPVLSGGTANGVLYLNGSKVATSGSALTFDGTNLGLQVTPSAWSTTTSVFENPSGSIYSFSGTNQIGLNSNAYYNGTNWIYRNASSVGAADFYMQNGFFVWRTAVAGTSPNIIAYSEQMRLTSTGLGIGTSSPSFKLDAQRTTAGTVGRFYSTAGTDANISIRNNTQEAIVGADNTQSYLLNAGAYPWTFWTNNLERMRLDSSGNLGLGVTPSASWDANIKALQIGPTSVFRAGSTSFTQATVVASNVRQASGVNSYIANGFATDYTQQSGAHYWYTAPSGTAGNAISFTQAMTLDASGRLGIGLTNPAYRLDVEISAGPYVARFRNSSTSTSEYNVALFGQGAAGAAIGYIGTGGSAVGNAAFANNFVVGTQTSNALVFNTADTERARITSGGDLLVGTTTVAGIGITVQPVATTIQNNNAQATGFVFTSYRRSSVEIGSITQNGTTAVLYNTTSDRRLKDNIVPAPSASDVIDAIEIVSHDWKSAPDEHVTYGVIAQDLALVAPQAVLRGDNGDEIEKTWGVDYSKLVPMLIKEIQSLRARVAALEKP